MEKTIDLREYFFILKNMDNCYINDNMWTYKWDS